MHILAGANAAERLPRRPPRTRGVHYASKKWWWRRRGGGEEGGDGEADDDDGLALAVSLKFAQDSVEVELVEG